jgi:DNA helicase-2/ATP-dependent DNA helicase PcrA
MDCSGDPRECAATSLRLIARYYHLKNADDPSAAAAKHALQFDTASERAALGLPSRLDAEKQLSGAFQDGVQMAGDPIHDWLKARELLNSAAALRPLFNDANLVRLFGARDALVDGLGRRWLASGTYNGAAELVRQVLDRERLISAERAPAGCFVMNMHKAKGKEFDGVVIIEGAYSGAFFRTKEDRQAGSASRRLLRVALTRARSLATLVRPHNATPLVG